MSCDRFSEAITDHACGASIDAATIAHLSACAGCQRLLHEQRQLLADADADLREAMTLTASSDFADRVHARVRHVDARRVPWVSVIRWWVVPTAAILALAVYLGLSGLRGGNARLPVASVSAPAERRPPAVPSPAQPSIHIPDRQMHRSAVHVKTRRPMPDRRVSPAPELQVIVAPDQMRAIARLKELLDRELIDEPTVTRSGAVELVIEPLSIPEIDDIQTGTGLTGDR
jgi:hypothetical protein